MKLILASLLVFAVIGLSSAYADIEITPVIGSSSPGCEITSCYIPNQASMNVGEKVTFHNTDSAAHTFTSGNPSNGPTGLFDSSLVMAGSSFEWTAESEGAFPYYCQVHPWMLGVLTVGQGSVVAPEIKVQSETNPVQLQQLQDENANLKSENLNLKIENRNLKMTIDENNSLIDSLQKRISDLNVILQEQVKVIYEWVISK